jgi:hypothetical protein
LMAFATCVFNRLSKRLQMVSSIVSAVTVLKAPMASDPNYVQSVVYNLLNGEYEPGSFLRRLER